MWAYLKGARPPGRPFIVHRLDRETSGLLVVAKTADAQRRLQFQFAAGTAERRYVAIVEGTVSRDEGTLKDVLVEERSLRVRPIDPSRPPPRGGRARIAITRYRVLERRADVTRVGLRLGTGRRHQIRVQMAKLGNPVLGDRRHGARRDPLRRLCLHATRLGFRHPETGAPVEFDSAPPPAFGDVGRPAEPRTTPPRPAHIVPDPRRREAGQRPRRPNLGASTAGPPSPRRPSRRPDLGSATTGPPLPRRPPRRSDLGASASPPPRRPPQRPMGRPPRRPPR